MLGENSEVEVSLRNGRLVIVPVSVPELSLKELVDGITKKNLHHEIATGAKRGNEAW